MTTALGARGDPIAARETQNLAYSIPCYDTYPSVPQTSAALIFLDNKTALAFSLFCEPVTHWYFHTILLVYEAWECIKHKVYSFLSSVLFLSGVINALFLFYQSDLYTFFAILAPPIGMSLALFGRFKGEKGILNHLGVWGNLLLLFFSFFC